MPDDSQTSRDISFTRNGQIKRNGIRVGWVEDREIGLRWTVRFTPASGRPGILGHYLRLREAKLAAVSALTAPDTLEEDALQEFAQRMSRDFERNRNAD